MPTRSKLIFYTLSRATAIQMITEGTVVGCLSDNAIVSHGSMDAMELPQPFPDILVIDLTCPEDNKRIWSFILQRFAKFVTQDAKLVFVSDDQKLARHLSHVGFERCEIVSTENLLPRLEQVCKKANKTLKARFQRDNRFDRTRMARALPLSPSTVEQAPISQQR